MLELDEVVKDFLVESAENLERLDREFVELERDPGRRDLLASIFRAIHTIKGTCGFFGFARLERLTHAGETLLARLRDGTRPMTRGCAEALLEMVDRVRAMLADIEATGADGTADHDALVRRLAALADGDPADEALDPAPARAEAALPAEDLAPAADGEAPIALPTPRIAPRPTEPEPRAEEAGDRGPAEPRSADATVRLDVAVLDNLMVLVGELVLARNQAIQASRAGADGLNASFQRIDHLTSALQEAVMRTRMLPLGNLFNRFPRVVRDLAVQCGKRVRLEIEGADTGLDRTLLEAIKDPLTHIVRNAIDHGFETPGERIAAGKPEEGRLLLRAFHEGGRVTIEIADDGKGIDVAKVKRRAIERGLLTDAAAARMSDREAQEIIFAPGFSTAESVTAISGRGVGMDVVRTNIAQLGGVVEIDSTQGKGTRLYLRVPLTLAIVPALIVRCAGQRFAIPQVSVQEIILLAEDGPKLEIVQGTSVFRLREALLPILRLDGELGLPAEAEGGRCIVVLLVGRQPFGLLLDAVADHMDIVVKPVGQNLAALGVFAGATVLGDGSVSLILDVAGFAARARMRVRAHDEVAGHGGAARDLDTERLLIVEGTDGTPLMVPLAQVTRIEEIAPERLEREPDGEVVQYRGRILPLVTLDGDVAGARPGEPLHVLVHAGPHGDVGIVVARVLDVVDVAIRDRRPSSRPGIRFTAIVRDRVTQMLDLRAVVERRIPTFYEAEAA